MNERLSLIYAKYSERFSFEVRKESLYIVSTPIGNLEDISFRAIDVLKKVDMIASEDTRITNFLLQQYDIKNKSISYHSNVETTKVELFMNHLKNGMSIALVSDAGTPCISDPGNILVSRCIEDGIEVYSIPGCSSLIHSLIVSGFSTKRFYFQGFLPHKKGRLNILRELSQIRMTIIIFESPFRIYKTLAEIHEVFGNREISVSRELTKKFEQTIRDSVKDLLDKQLKIKGEFVIVINNN